MKPLTKSIGNAFGRGVLIAALLAATWSWSYQAGRSAERLRYEQELRSIQEQARAQIMEKERQHQIVLELVRSVEGEDPPAGRRVSVALDGLRDMREGQ